MIPRTADWKNALANAIRDPAELLALLELPRALLPAARRAASVFPLRVPRGYAALMARGEPGDPLLRQVLPLGDELGRTEGFGTDPVGDRGAERAPGVLHKYEGRALLVATGACAVHCRYCFRRHFPYGDVNAGAADWSEAVGYLEAHPEIGEVILSGGDPLLLDDEKLSALTRRLERSGRPPRRLRIHTRLPVVLPERVDDGLLHWLDGLSVRPVVVLHANHANELAPAAVEALRRLAGTGAMLLNQSVLLRGVNDNPESLAALSEALLEAGVLPYYLHLLDRVEGAAHFEVAESAAKGLHDALRRRLPGYLVPRLAREVAKEPYKRLV